MDKVMYGMALEPCYRGTGSLVCSADDDTNLRVYGLLITVSTLQSEVLNDFVFI